MADPKTIAADPTYLPDALDANRRMIRFAKISRQALAKEPFLDQRKNGAVTEWAEARIDDLLPHLSPAPPPALILHSAFCGSTLIARALDAPGTCLSLKEPNILMDLVNARRVTPALQSGKAFDEIANAIAGLISRRHQPNEAIVIKPTNSASPIADPPAFRAASKLYLYGSLREFLLSLLKKGEEARAFVRQQYNIFSLDRTGLSGIEPRRAMGMTDLQVAALVWRHQLEEFARRLKDDARAASVDYATMIEDPARSIGAIAKHLSLPLAEADIEKAATGPIFKTNSKFANEDFDAGVRERENAEVAARYAKEISLIEGWIAPISLGVEMKTPLARRLTL